MMSWQEKIPACFGDADMFFGRHPLDFQRGADLLATLVKEQVQYEIFADEVVRFLKSKNCGDEHIEHEMTLISMLYVPWIEEGDD